MTIHECLDGIFSACLGRSPSPRRNKKKRSRSRSRSSSGSPQNARVVNFPQGQGSMPDPFSQGGSFGGNQGGQGGTPDPFGQNGSFGSNQGGQGGGPGSFGQNGPGRMPQRIMPDPILGRLPRRQGGRQMGRNVYVGGGGGYGRNGRV